MTRRSHPVENRVLSPPFRTSWGGRLGTLYDLGEGVPQDSVRAYQLYERAAAQGHVPSRTKLGVANMLGEGAPLDPVRAYMWLALAIAGGDLSGEPSLIQLEEELSPEDLAKARTLAKEWRAGRRGGAESF